MLRRRVPIALLFSLTAHLAILIGLFIFSSHESIPLDNSPAGGVIWLNLNPGGEGSGGAGGTSNNVIPPVGRVLKPDVARVFRPARAATELRSNPKTPHDTEIQTEKKNKNESVSNQELTAGDGLGNKTGIGEGRGIGLGQGEGAGIGEGKGPGGMGPLGTGGPGGSGSNILSNIRRKIASAKRYPVQARREGIEGACGLSFAINSDGSLRDVSLTASSGYPLLDEEAIATVQRAAPFPVYTDPIRLSLRFSLNENN